MQPAKPRVFQSGPRRITTVGTPEVRNPGLPGMPYCLMLSRHGIAHVYNHWSGMPTRADQHTRLQGFTAVFTVLRLLTPLGMLGS